MPQESLLKAIGGTSCFRLNNISRAKAKLFVKLEYLNPGGMSARLAASLIEQLENTGRLRSGDTVICACDGQWELSLALVCAQKGLNLAVVQEIGPGVEPHSHLQLMRALILQTPSGQSSQTFARATANERGWHFLQTSHLPKDGKKFFDSTVFELLNDFSEEHVDYLVIPRQIPALADLLAERIHRSSPTTRVLFSKLDNGDRYTSELAFPPHVWQPGLVGQPPVVVSVSPPVAWDGCKTAMHKEGLLLGKHSGAALAVGLQLAEQQTVTGNIAIILSDSPQTGTQGVPLAHMGTLAYKEINQILGITDMDETLSGQATPLPVMDVKEEDALMADVTLEMLKQLVLNPSSPVVMFGLEWCEFCWAVRKLFRRLSIPIHSVDLDSTTYRPARLGPKMRTTLSAYTGSSSLPQIFIGGEFIGSHLELFDMISNRSLFKKLDASGVNYNRVLDIDPYTLLPGWTHAPTHSL